MRWRAEVNKHLGVDSELVGPEEVKEACPQIDLTCGGHAPMIGALFHPPGAIVRHDAVAWGYGRGADRRGVEIHQQTEVLGIDVKDGRVVGVHTEPWQHRHAQGPVRGRRFHAADSGHGRPALADHHPSAAGDA